MTTADHAGAELAREVDRILAGERAADGFLKTLRAVCTTGDELHQVVTRILAQGDGVALKACLREIQKALERSRA
jgi:hypothetical protein